MISIPAFLFDDPPWFRTVLAWIVAILILWALAAGPAYLLLRLVHSLRARAVAAIDGALNRYREAREVRREARLQLRRQILCDHGLIKSADEREHRWNEAVASIRSPVERLAHGVTTVYKGLTRSAERLKGLSVPDLRQVSIPRPEELSEDYGTYRLALVNLVFAGLLLVACVGVNMGMLGQIIRDLDLIPDDRYFLGVRLATIFAALLTLIEAGMGFLYAKASDTEDEARRRLTVGTVVTIFGASAIAFVEGFFYSRIGFTQGGSRLEFDIPGTDVRMSYESVFFIWGAVLVLALFGFGLNAHRAISTMVRHGSVRRLKSVIEKVVSAAAQSQDDVDGLRKAVFETERTTAKVEVVATLSVSRMSELKAALQEFDASQGALKMIPISQSEARLLEYRTLFWFGIVVVAAGVLCGLRPVAGIAATLFSLAVGVSIRSRPEAVLESALFGFLTWRRVIAGALIAATTILLAAVLVPAGWRVWVPLMLVLLVGAAQLSPLLAFLGIHLRRLRDALITILAVAGIASAQVGKALLLVVESLLSLAAAPAAVVLGGRSK